MKKVKTMKVSGGAEYAKVSERLKMFHADCTSGSIETQSTPVGEKMIVKAIVNNGKSKTATGSAFGKVGGNKEYEKLETIAVGRALAFLGYLADGDVASSEEMEEFEEYQKEKNKPALELVKNAKNLADLKKIYKDNEGLGAAFTKAVIKRKNEIS